MMFGNRRRAKALAEFRSVEMTRRGAFEQMVEASDDYIDGRMSDEEWVAITAQVARWRRESEVAFAKAYLS